MALVCCCQWSYLSQGAEGRRNNVKCRDRGYFQVSWLPSFHEAGGLCCWNPNSSLVAYIPALGIQQFLTTGNLTQRALYLLWGIFFFFNWECGVLFMGSDSSHMHIQYDFWTEKVAERSKHATERSNLGLETLQRMIPPSAESCLVKLRWRQAGVTLCFLPFLLPHTKSSTRFSWGINIKQPPQEGMGCLRAWSLYHSGSKPLVKYWIMWRL